jgi:hypothetical protein
MFKCIIVAYKESIKVVRSYLSVYSFIPNPQKRIIKGICIGLKEKLPFWVLPHYQPIPPVHTFLATFCIQIIPLVTFCIQDHLEQYVSESKK